MSNRLRDFLRDFFKAIAVYAAGAWVAIEVVDFAVQQYGLSDFLVDAAVIVAFGGGMITAVLAWFHGEPGGQRVSKSEMATIGVIVIATASVLLYLSSASPTKAFEVLPGYRLVVEHTNRYSPTEFYHIGMSPMEAIEMIDGGMLSLNPQNGVMRGPGIRGDFDGHPTMFIDPKDSDFVVVTFVLPYQPADLEKLIVLGPTHDGVNIQTEGLDLEINSRVVITEQDRGATIRVSN